jgi:N-acetylmuramoyl-L-alanine amidase
VGLCWGGVGLAATRMRVRVSPWDAAVAARQTFEGETAGTHTPADYGEVMDGFRAIYHADPGDAHAARAVLQVAELLAEQGREFGDKKSLRDAAGQYEFVAKAYPGGSLAPAALVQAQDLLGPEGAGDAVEARKVRAKLAAEYPKYARGEKTATRSVEEKGNSGGERPVVADRPTHHDETVMNGAPADAFTETPTSHKRDLGHTATGSAGRADVGRAGSESAKTDDTAVDTPTSQKRDGGHPDGVEGAAPVRLTPVVRDELAKGRVVAVVTEKVPVGPLAVVTGIRHWSTASYTRVAIDLNVGPKEDVKYEAARVENPDRIFFDLQHARLAPQLAGKSFSVTDDGFLTKIRAAQFSDEVTRVVLDVHQVAEYSAFLLPNPYRLIIDIHGKAGEQVAGMQVAGMQEPGAVPQSAGARPDEVAAVAAPVIEAPVTKRGGVEMSSLPPMPVTDGSGSFGLPVRTSRTAKSSVVAAPRVVISSKPTMAKPVPNTVTKSSNETGFEVAAVSLQQGKVEATRTPTSKPISSGSREQSAGIREQGLGIREQQSKGDHYQKPQMALGGGDGSGGSTPASLRRDAHPSEQVRSAGTPDGGHSLAAATTVGVPAEVAPPMADGETSLVRALGLKIGRIVIDAGHGGHDSGTLGAGGIEEKDVVLDVALRLGKLLHDRLGAEIVYTRADDTFIPLETRTAIANKAQADLFISVHANSSVDTDARGVEVYYLNFTSDPEAMRVASRENAVSTESVHELSDLVKKIALKDKIEESKELASDVDTSLYGGLRRGNAGLRDRGVKKAPFVVLIGANMPSILAEISFVTNPVDAAELETPGYRERVAESLYKGVARYAAGINGQGMAGVASKSRTTEQAAR